jgi:hypothetical protein
MAALSAIAIPTSPGELTVERLRQRMFHLQLTTSVAPRTQKLL